MQKSITFSKRQRSMVLFGLLMAIVLLAVAARRLEAQTANIASVVAADDAQNALATPMLIDAAYARGEISTEERLLYLAYAIYEPGSLPARFRSNAPWHGTAVVAELNLAWRAVDAQGVTASPLMATFDRIMAEDAATVCKEQDGAGSLESANFHLNYGTIGGGLDAQAYLDSLERTYAVEVTDYGWAAPPLCSAGSGSCSAANPWGKYPVQAASLASGLYGYVTSNGGSYTGMIGDNPNTAAVETDAIASCMVLNRNYSGFPGGAQFSLDVTAAHEHVHSIQFGLGDPFPFEDNMWYESSAAYMEDEVLDAANDNYQYLWPTFDACLGEYSGGVYSNWLFFRYAAETNGGTNVSDGGEDVMQQFWVNVGAGQSGQKAYDKALSTKGSNLKDVFHDYAITSRFMKSCPSAAPYCFEEAAGYVAAKGALSDDGQIAAIGNAYNGSLRNNYAMNWVQLPKSGPYNVILKNLSAGGQFRVSVVADMGNTLQVTPFPAAANGSQQVTLASYMPPAGVKKVVAIVTNQQVTADDPNACTTNSYRLSVGTATEPPDSQTPQAYLPMVAKPPELPQSLIAIEDATVLQGYPTDNTCDTTDMWAGYDDRLDPDGQIVRSLVKFDLSGIPAGTKIGSAALNARHVKSWDFDRSQTITTYAATSSWSECTVVWDNQPGMGAAYGSQTLPRAPGLWYAFDITALVQGWIDGSIPNHGVWLRGPEISGTDSSWRGFATSESDDVPYLSIAYPGVQTSASIDERSVTTPDIHTSALTITRLLTDSTDALFVCSSDGKCLSEVRE